MKTIRNYAIAVLIGFIFGGYVFYNLKKCPCDSVSREIRHTEPVHIADHHPIPDSVVTQPSKPFVQIFHSKSKIVKSSHDSIGVSTDKPPVDSTVNEPDDCTTKKYYHEKSPNGFITATMSTCGDLLSFDLCDDTPPCPLVAPARKITVAPFIFAGGYRIPEAGVGVDILFKRSIVGYDYDLMNKNHRVKYGIVFGW